MIGLILIACQICHSGQVLINLTVAFLPAKQGVKPMSETKPGMSSPALTEDDVRRIADERIREFFGTCGCIMLYEKQLLVVDLKQYNKWCRDMDYSQYELLDTSEDQGEYNDIQEVSVKDSVTAD